MLFVGVALGEPIEAVVEADGHAPDLDRFESHSADDAVRTGSGPAADDDANAFDRHGGCFYAVIEPRYSKRRLNSPGVRCAASASRSTQAECAKSSASSRIMYARATRNPSLATSTRRTFVLPLSGSTRSSNGIGTKRPPWIVTMAPLPPSSKNRTAL